MQKLIALVLFCLIAVQLRAEPELKGSPAELTAYLSGVPQLVSIAGEAEVKVPADRALIALKVVTENKALQEASRTNQEIRARILRTLAERGLPAERIKASKFSSTPKYGVFKEKARSYRVENVVKITAHDEKEFQAVASLVDGMSEVRYESVEFEHSDKDGLKAKVLAQAIDKAHEKKKLYEEKLGVKLSPKSFNEGSVVPMPQPMLRRYMAEKSAYPASVTPLPGRAVAPAFDGDAVEEMSASFNELIYTARVTIEYALEGK